MSAAAAREHNQQLATLLAETSVLFDQDDLSSEEADELRALIDQAEKAQAAAQAKVAAREAEEAKKTAVLQAERDAVTAAAAERARLQAELRRRSDEAEQRRLRERMSEWEASSGLAGLLDSAVEMYRAENARITEERYLDIAREVFAVKLGIQAPPVECWERGSSELDWGVRIFGGALLVTVSLPSALLMHHPADDVQPTLVIQAGDGSVKLPTGVIFVNTLGTLGKVLAEHSQLQAALRERVS